tara:strand:- start:98 stop:226 length:129 start_codon:yes stop_codon:yes gene_type:complete
METPTYSPSLNRSWRKRLKLPSLTEEDRKIIILTILAFIALC